MVNKIIVMRIFTKMYSSRLNVVWDTNFAQDTNVIRDSLSSNFCGDQIKFITKICSIEIECVGYLENINCFLVSKLLYLATEINASQNVVRNISKTTTRFS